MSSVRSVVLAGGGTGGHIYPLLAFADCLRRHDPDLRITCIGSRRGLESELIPPHGYELRHVPAYQLPRKVNVDLVKTPLRMWRSMHAARAVLDDVAADVVVGFGGYVAVPAYLAAWRRRTPIVIHEVNVPPGVANRLGMRFTDHVAVGFPHQPAQSPDLGTAEVVGVPLRTSIAALERGARREEARKRFDLDPDLPTLLVTGASQGARTINRAIAGAAKAVTDAGIQVLHLSGARNEPVEIAGDLAVPYRTLTYLDEMELAYAAADLALCRSGAMTCAELAAVGLAAVYVPYPHSNREQYRNALPVVDAGGGVVVDDSELTADWITENLVPLALDGKRLARMNKAVASYGRRDGDEALRAFMLEAVTGEPTVPSSAVATANAAAESVAGLSAATGAQPAVESDPIVKRSAPSEPDSYPGSLFEPVRRPIGLGEGPSAAEDAAAATDTPAAERMVAATDDAVAGPKSGPTRVEAGSTTDAQVAGHVVAVPDGGETVSASVDSDDAGSTGADADSTDAAVTSRATGVVDPDGDPVPEQAGPEGEKAPDTRTEATR